MRASVCTGVSDCFSIPFALSRPDLFLWVRFVLEIHLVLNLLLCCATLIGISRGKSEQTATTRQRNPAGGGAEKSGKDGPGQATPIASKRPSTASAKRGPLGKADGVAGYPMGFADVVPTVVSHIWSAGGLVPDMIVLVKVLALTVSIGTNIMLPDVFDEWMAVFYLAFTGTASMTCGLPFKHNVVVSSVVLLFGVPFLLWRGSDWPSKMHNTLMVVVLTCASLYMTFFFDQAVRAQFRLYVVFRLERRRVLGILLNLLPEDIAKRMLRHAGRLPSEVRRAVVLQLDLWSVVSALLLYCCWTSASRTRRRDG